jgi:hypothetical protein
MTATAIRPAEPRGHSTAASARPEYKYPAARQAHEAYGKNYADYIEAHTAELVAKGYDVAERNLGEALMGNDGE